MRTIAVDGIFNVRSIGGHAPWLVRSGAPEEVTEAGIETLAKLGVSVVIDLREPSERGTVRHGIPVQSVRIYGEAPPQTGRLEDIYDALLAQRGHALTAAVGAIADAEGAALVHCTAGKDRTGLVVALARLAAGDSAAAVIADYTRSAPEVRPHRQAHAHAVANTLPEAERAETIRLHVESPPEAIEHALKRIANDGGAPAYLARHGLRPDQLAALRRKREEAL